MWENTSTHQLSDPPYPAASYCALISPLEIHVDRLQRIALDAHTQEISSISACYW